MLWAITLLLPLAAGSELLEVLQLEVVEYTSPVINTTYIATDEFDTRAMGPLYNATPYIIDAIVNKQAYPEGFVTVEEHIELASPKENWRLLVAYYAGPISVVTVALLAAAALPLAGLIWCCCYWCRSKRRRPFDRKCDACLKGILALVMIGLLTLFLFGIVCAFASDAQTEEGLENAPRALTAGIHDARAYLNATQAHAKHLLVDNYRQLEDKLNALLTSSSITVPAMLVERTRAGAAATTLVTILRSMNATLRDLKEIKSLSALLQQKAEVLNAELRKVKGDLLQTLAQCVQPQCLRLQEKYKIGELGTEIQYSQLPDVSALVARVAALEWGDAATAREVDGLVHLRAAVARVLSKLLPSLQQTLRATGVRLEKISTYMTENANNASAWLQRRERLAADMSSVHKQYGAYRLYSARAAPAIATLICLLLTWGLVCGVCGKRPDVYGASDCCNKGAGSSCLLCGMSVIFLGGTVLLALMVVYFLVGITSVRVVCDPLLQPEGNRLVADLELAVDLEKAMFENQQGKLPAEEKIDMRSILRTCHQNYTIYEVLQLRRIYNLEAMEEEVLRELTEKVKELQPRLSLSHVRILPDGARKTLSAFAKSGLAEFNLDRILDALDTNMTSLPLLELSAQLARAGAALQPRPGFETTARALGRQADALRAVHYDTLQPLAAAAALLRNVTSRLRDRLYFNQTSQKDVSHLLFETEQAESSLNEEATPLVQNMTRDYGNVVIQLVKQYMDRVLHGARYDVGRCGPLSHAYNATTQRACKHVFTPVNGYWVSLAWCALLLPALLLVSSKLARLYTHLDPYPGPMADNEYLYDAYADRDNVPLANAYKAEKRTSATRSARAPDANPRRYNDMAPKHWEEGPPRYHGPTEYERPPPYYYPGSTDRQ